MDMTCKPLLFIFMLPAQHNPRVPFLTASGWVGGVIERLD